MAVKSSTDYAEVYVWLPKDSKGAFTNSLTGYLEYKLKAGSARVGHVAFAIFQNGIRTRYMSLWEGEIEHKITKEKRKVAALQDFDDDLVEEKGPPTAIIRFHKLNISEMVKVCDTIIKRLGSAEIQWASNAPYKRHIDQPGNKEANCATLVYTLLIRGGLRTHPYHIHAQGPANRWFYTTTRCHLGEIGLGEWNGSSNGWFFSPKALLLIAAAAAYYVKEDQNNTIHAMCSDRVEKVSLSSGGYTSLLSEASVSTRDSASYRSSPSENIYFGLISVLFGVGLFIKDQVTKK